MTATEGEKKTVRRVHTAIGVIISFVVMDADVDELYSVPMRF